MGTVTLRELTLKDRTREKISTHGFYNWKRYWDTEVVYQTRGKNLGGDKLNWYLREGEPIGCSTSGRLTEALLGPCNVRGGFATAWTPEVIEELREKGRLEELLPQVKYAEIPAHQLKAWYDEWRKE